MKRRLLVIAILGVVVVAALLLLHSRPRFLDVVLRIVYRKHDAILHTLEVTPEGHIYALQELQKNLQVQAYDPNGRPLWLAPVAGGTTRNVGGVIASFERLRPAYTALAGLRTNPNALWVTVSNDRKVTTKSVRVNPDNLESRAYVIPTRDYAYVTGSTFADNLYHPTAIKTDYAGLYLWRRIETSDDVISGPAAIDNEDNLILTGDVGAGVGPYVVKYSTVGKRMWKRETEVLDGTKAIWAGTDRRGRILTIFGLHQGIVAHSGEDMSRRKQDYVLSIYSPVGKLLSTVRLSHGAWLDIVDAAINGKGEVIAAGNRRKTTLLGYPRKNENAQLIKCDADGKIAWSRAVRLPPGYLVNHIKLDDKGGIYILGIGRDASDVNAFIYKVMDPG